MVYPSFYNYVYYLIMSLQMMNVWITVAVSFERYIAICHPFRAARFITRRKTLITMLVIGLVSFLYNIPHIIASHAAPCGPDPAAPPPTLVANVTHVNNMTVNSTLDYISYTSRAVDYSVSSVLPVSSGQNDTQSVLSAGLHTTPSVPTVHCLKVTETEFGLSEGYIVYRSYLYTIVIYVVPFSALLFLNG